MRPRGRIHYRGSRVARHAVCRPRASLRCNAATSISSPSILPPATSSVARALSWWSLRQHSTGAQTRRSSCQSRRAGTSLERRASLLRSSVQGPRAWFAATSRARSTLRLGRVAGLRAYRPSLSTTCWQSSRRSSNRGGEGDNALETSPSSQLRTSVGLGLEAAAAAGVRFDEQIARRRSAQPLCIL